MEEQNILTGDITCLNQIKSDIKTHNNTREKKESMSVVVRELEKNIELSEKAVKDEIDSTLKTRREAVEAGFDKEISSDQEKLKKIHSDRDKAKLKGVKERILSETESLREENKELRSDIKVAFKNNKIPTICSTRLFIALFLTKGFRDVCISLITFCVSFLVIPSAIYYLVPNMPDWSLFIIYATMAAILFGLYKLLNDKYKFKHYETFQGLIQTKDKISENNKQIKKIQRAVKKDKNEEMYGLGKFDEKIKLITNDIEKFEAKKAMALEEFENLVKPNIIAEIRHKDIDRINGLKEELKKKSDILRELENKVKEQRIYIAANYEAYLGNTYISLDKLEALSEIMNTGEAETIGQAISVYQKIK